MSHEPALSAVEPEESSFPVMLGLSVAAFGTFAWLWGFERALLVAVVIMIHEGSHALAMWMVGIRIKGVALVPFFGGVAIPAEPILHDGKHGFVALMGPGFSLVTTFAFVLASQQMNEPRLVAAAMTSAVINLVNLVPVLPFDGGRVMKSGLGSFSQKFAQLIGIAGAVGGFWFAWVTRDVVIGIFTAMGLLMALGVGGDDSEAEPEPMQRSGAMLLLAGYAATIVAYVLLIQVIVDGDFDRFKFAAKWHW